ncbi:MAG: tRNA (adenosine(37)-N6)-dimethylallyltransferase MiaA, partial [Bacteroidota bacterium]
MNTPYNLIIILGATATGKTKLAANLANQLNTEIISADSRQVYRDMNIGTGKDLNEYVINGKQIPYHLIDILAAGSDYNLHLFQRDFFKTYDEIVAKNKIPILCGGTSLYINGVLKGHAHTPIPENTKLRMSLDGMNKKELVDYFIALPETPYKSKADTSTFPRMIRAIEICTWEQTNTREENEAAKNLKPIIFGLDMAVDLKRKRVEERLKQRLENGLIEEVRELLVNGVSKEKLIFYGLEYKFVVMYLKKKITLDEMTKQLTIAIQQFAKQQMTFFRKME